MESGSSFSVRNSSNTILTNSLGNSVVNLKSNGDVDFLDNLVGGVGSLAVGTVSQSSCAILKLDSTNQGILLPRLTTSQKNAITSPVNGLLVFDTTLGKLSYYNSGWQELGDVSLSGDVTGTQSSTVVSTIDGVSAEDIAVGATLANNATSSNQANTLVKRDGSGNFITGQITFANGGTGLNYYEEGTYTSTFDGPFTATSFTLRVVRIGKLITISSIGIYGNGAGVTYITNIGGTLLPLKWRPNGGVSYILPGFDNGLSENVYLLIQNDGRIMIAKDANFSNFSGTSASCGIQAFCVSYLA